MAITIQYEHHGKILTRLIGIKRLLSSHTGAYIAKVLRETLARFDLSIDDIYAICTDNGANMIRAVTVIRLYQSHLVDDFLLNDLPFFEREQAYSIFIDREIKKHAGVLSDSFGKYAFGIHCAAHTTELAVRDGLKVSIEEGKIIEKARSMIKKLRNDNMMSLITLKKLPKPFVDNITRWSSVYMMLKSLLKLRQLCEELSCTNDDFVVDSEFWNSLSTITNILKFPADALQKLQKSSLALSDVYGIFTLCCLQLEKMEVHKLAANLLIELKRREPTILKSTSMYACMYLDPRFQCALNQNEKDQAKKHLAVLYRKIEATANSQKPAEITSNVENISAVGEFVGDFSLLDESLASATNLVALDASIAEDNGMNLLENMLREKCSSEVSQNKKAIEILLEEFDFSNSHRVKSDASIFDYWVNRQESRPELYRLVSVLLSVPPTDVVSERHFSVLNFVFTKYRNTLSDEALERIMFIKCNEDIFMTL